MPFCSLRTPAAIVLAALLLGACGLTSAAAPAIARPAQPATTAPAPIGGPQVVIGNFAFTPNTLTVAAGTTVTWVNHDDIPHTVTAKDHSFTSSGLDTEDSFSHQFNVAGTYAYYCTIHATMTATIIVR